MKRDEIERMPHRDPSLMSNEELLAALNSHDDLDAEIALRFHVIWSALDAALAREAATERDYRAAVAALDDIREALAVPRGVFQAPDDVARAVRGELDARRDRCKALTQALAAAHEREAKLRGALEWYASDEAWRVDQVEGPDGDYGKLARAALDGEGKG